MEQKKNIWPDRSSRRPAVKRRARAVAKVDKPAFTDHLPGPVRKGRGAVNNPAGRYEPTHKAAFDDGWSTLDEPAPPLRTTVTSETPRTIITRNQSPDLAFDRSINPYRGCEHGCIYCFARPTHAWMNLSPGLDFESRLFAKTDAPALLQRELAKPDYRCRPIAMGTNTDPYQPIERHHQLTRQILTILAAANHPVSIVTKSALVSRDLDILGPMAKKGLVRVYISITTLDRTLARKMEPRAATPAKRLATLRSLEEAGVPCGVMVAPIVPALTDDEFEAVLAAAAEAGAECAGYILLRLPLEVKDLFSDWLHHHYPDRAKRVLNRIAEMRNGALNDPNFGTRMVGDGTFARLLKKRFIVATRRFGLARDQARDPARDQGTLRTDLFRAPIIDDPASNPPPPEHQQLRLL